MVPSVPSSQRSLGGWGARRGWLGAAGGGEAAAAPGRRWTLSISPAHLLLPMLEATAELEALPGFGLAAVGGLGRFGDDDESYLAYEAGLQARYYLIGDFTKGLQLGAEALWMGVRGGEEGSSVVAVGSGLQVGPFLGYKIVAGPGFTFELQVGAQYLLVEMEARDSSDGTSASAADNELILLLNLGLGWTF